MRNLLEIENIEALRRRAGIHDIELRKEIRGLRVGDSVWLTLLTGNLSCAGEMLLVQITRIRGRDFRGKLASKPAGAALVNLGIGSPLVFTAAHIHSLPKRAASS
jgi:hypothetical protein